MLIQLGNYSENTMCDVLPMDAAQVLLGHLWIDDLDALYFYRESTYVLKHGYQKIIMIPAKPIERD